MKTVNVTFVAWVVVNSCPQTLRRNRRGNTFQAFVHISQSDTYKTTTRYLFDLSRNGEGAHRAISLPIVVRAWNLHVD